MTKEELGQKAKQIIKLEMVKKEINFVDLHKLMLDKGYDYTLDAIRQKVGRGTYDARFLFAFADSLELDVCLTSKI
jgi:hypothetical protein